MSKEIKYAEVLKADTSDSLLVKVWYSDAPDKNNGSWDSKDHYDNAFFAWRKECRLYMVPPKEYKPFEDLVRSSVALDKKIAVNFVTIYSQAYIKKLTDGFPIPGSMLVIDEGSACVWMKPKEKALPVFNIYQKDEKVGVIYNQEIADKISEYLNKGNEYISAFAFDTGKMIEKMIEIKSNQAIERVMKLEAQILSFREKFGVDQFVWGGNEHLIDAYDKHFDVKTDTVGEKSSSKEKRGMDC